MKKLLLAAFAAAFLCTAAQAADQKAQTQPADPFEWTQPTYKTYTVFNLGIFPKIPGWQDNTETIGIKTGWPAVTGMNATMTGFESSWAYSGSEYVTGLQASMAVDWNRYCRGMQAVLGVNFSMEALDGMQAAVGFNFANNIRGMQAGSMNFAQNLTGFGAGVIGNITGNTEGVQAGLFDLTGKLDGLQFGGINIVKESCDNCWQVGLWNQAKEKGIQFGLINIIKGGKMPFMILFNYAD